MKIRWIIKVNDPAFAAGRREQRVVGEGTWLRVLADSRVEGSELGNSEVTKYKLESDCLEISRKFC